MAELSSDLIDIFEIWNGMSCHAALSMPCFQHFKFKPELYCTYINTNHSTLVPRADSWSIIGYNALANRNLTQADENFFVDSCYVLIQAAPPGNLVETCNFHAASARSTSTGTVTRASSSKLSKSLLDTHVRVARGHESTKEVIDPNE
jgi:hypothetical protein